MFSTDRDRNDTVRAWAHETHGWHGATGGWVYDSRGRAVRQGWGSILYSYRREIRDWLTVRLTAFESFDAMLNTSPTYRPTIFERNAQYRFLADEYDLAQAIRHDPRRAFRGSRRHSLTPPIVGGV
jgi:hypothetical protein